jgi:flagellin-specific chaperone FliS
MRVSSRGSKAKHELAKPQSDFYVFLSKRIVLADMNQDFQALDSVRENL